MRYLIPLAILPILSACVAPQEPTSYLKQWHVHNYTSKGFDHCKGYGCRLIDHVQLDKKSWRSIDRIFKRKSKSAIEERSRLSRAIGKFEKIVAPITNTATDVHGTFYEMGDDQLDCVDESINTTTYLLLLQERGHLKFHDIEQPTSRPILVGGNRWPHQSAVIREKDSQVRYVVDSWFENSGENAHVVPVKEWTYGWSPRKAGLKPPQLEKEHDKQKEAGSRIIKPIN